MNTTKPTVPAPVLAWVESHCGVRTPKHVPGQFTAYAQSRAAAYWGQPLGGVDIGGGYKVAVSQPSPQRKGDPAFFFYDFETNA